MSVRVIVAAMVAGTALVVLVASRRSPDPKPLLQAQAQTPQRRAEEPWLSKEAAAEIVHVGGDLGPLFDGVELGGPAPSAAIRERIETFARANYVQIDLDIVDARLDALRFSVTYGGCCGYEGADLLATRLARPSVGGGCFGGEPMWINDWAVTNENGTYLRARVQVNRVDVRWERTLTTPALIERANGLIGKDAAALKAAERSHWNEVGNRNTLAVPYHFQSYGYRYAVDMRSAEYGLELVVAHGRISQVSFQLPDLGDDGERLAHAKKTMQATWGRPVKKTAEMWTWRTADRYVTAELGSWSPRVSIREL